MSQKADLTTFRAMLEAKASFTDIEAQQRFIEKLAREVECRVTIKEFDQHVHFARNAVDDL